MKVYVFYYVDPYGTLIDMQVYKNESDARLAAKNEAREGYDVFIEEKEVTE